MLGVERGVQSSQLETGTCPRDKHMARAHCCLFDQINSKGNIKTVRREIDVPEVNLIKLVQ
jgi:hypothetical protein